MTAIAGLALLVSSLSFAYTHDGTFFRHLQTHEMILSGAHPIDLPYSATGLGDVNGDGIADYAIGMPYDKNRLGTVVVYSGEDGSELYTLGGACPFGDPVCRYEFGSTVARAGDLNQDGFNDLFVTAIDLYSDRLRYVMAYSLGGPSPVKLFEISDDFFWNNPNDWKTNFGEEVTTLGNLWGDASPEFAISAPKTTNVTPATASYSGRVVIYTYVSNAPNPDFPFTRLAVLEGEEIGERFGTQMVALRDVTEDGRNDFAVTATGGPALENPNVNPNLNSYFQVFSGQPLLIGHNRYTFRKEYRVDGNQKIDGFGKSLANIGDFNGDSYDDLMLGIVEDAGGCEEVIPLASCLRTGKAVIYSGWKNDPQRVLAEVNPADLNAYPTGNFLRGSSFAQSILSLPVGSDRVAFPKMDLDGNTTRDEIVAVIGAPFCKQDPTLSPGEGCVVVLARSGGVGSELFFSNIIFQGSDHYNLTSFIGEQGDRFGHDLVYVGGLNNDAFGLLIANPVDQDPEDVRSGTAVMMKLQPQLSGSLKAIRLSDPKPLVLDLDMGERFAGYLYWVLGSTLEAGVGNGAGIPLPTSNIGNLFLPLFNDAFYMKFTMNRLNTGQLQNTLGFLDSNGRGSATAVIEPQVLEALVGQALYHAYVVYDPVTLEVVYTSNTVETRIEH